MEAINLSRKFSLFQDYWSPKIVGELNDAYVKLVKVKGEFVWHHHEAEDELFLVVKGRLRIRLRDRDLHLNTGELAIISRGVEHQPVAEDEAHILLLEPKSTLNTGNVTNERTVAKLERI
ncbi:MAG: cupin domain-containing protein [Bacillati bacterium ANGP1]|uniref:Cupin domain-containing protein n=1 Tax=Candidatus Segetimicrobium genomatis TaxID=2569760 RepID=A0A537JVT9_9BACT|nr:MAG: cupin domain-containing protein [Terrabacteria group bacterium ANGP1]